MILQIVFLGLVFVAEVAEIADRDPGQLVGSDKSLRFVNNCWSSTNLNLSGLGIVTLGRYAFSFCNNVTTLDVSNNWIKTIAEDTFSNMANLENLSLKNNDLGGTDFKGAFHGLANLKSLDISHNPLSTILGRDSFTGLSNFCEIHIGKSRNFRTITPLVFGKGQEPASKNRSSTIESKNCPDHLDDRIEMFEVERSWLQFGKGHEDRHKLMDEPYSKDDVKMCKNKTIVRFVDFSNVTDTASPNCRTILMNFNRTKLKIYDDSLTAFDSRWFRIRNTSVNAVYLYPKNFENLTSDLLNDLPENIRFFSLQESDLERLDKGVMFNRHLRGLDLSVNFIRFIEKDAFAGLNLTRLNLGYNPIVTLDYVTTLPGTLLWLNLDYTQIREIPGNSFAHLKNLLALSLSGNNITELQPPALDGLVSLQWLDLALASVRNLRPRTFRDLSKLFSVDLTYNYFTLNEGVFEGMKCLAKLDLRWNRLMRIGRGTFDGLTENLEVMDLNQSGLEILEADAFVGVPKYNLTLESNDIWKIEKDAFDLPYLRYLDLRRNNITLILKGAMKSLGNLANKTEIRLGFNPIERLENGVFVGVSSKVRISLAGTRIKIIQAGVFDDS